MPRPITWDIWDADAALAWLIRQDLRLKIPIEDERLVKSAIRIRKLGPAQRLEEMMKLRNRLDPDLRARMDQAVRSARARRRQESWSKARGTIQAPNQDIERLREYARRNNVTIVTAFRQALEALEKQEKLGKQTKKGKRK